jgi:hypothetical protein
MGKYLKEAAITIEEMEVTDIVNGTAYVRIMGIAIAVSVSVFVSVSVSVLIRKKNLCWRKKSQ